VTAGSFGAVASEGIELVADLGHHLTVRVLDSKRMVSSDEPVRPHKRDGSHHTSSVDTGADPEAGVSASNLSFEGSGRHKLGLAQARAARIQGE